VIEMDANAIKKIVQEQIAVADATKNASVAYTKANIAAKLFSGTFGPFFDMFKKTNGIIGKFTKIFTPVTALFKLANNSLGGIVGTFTIMTGILMAVGALFLGLSGNVGSASGSMDIIKAAMDGVKDAITMMINKISEIDFAPVFDVATTILTNFGELFLYIIAQSIVAIEDIIGYMTSTFMPVWAALTNAVSELGITSGGVMESISKGVEMVKSAFESAAIQGIIQGYIDVYKLFGEIFAAVAILIINGIVSLVKKYQEFANNNQEVVAGIAGAWKAMAMIIVTLIMGLLDTYKLVLSNILALVQGDIGIVEAFKNIAGGIWDIFENMIKNILGLFGDMKDNLVAPFEYLYDKASQIIGDILGMLDFDFPSLGGIAGGIGDALSFSGGGIASGPSSGYPATLHGTEAVVPLPDGKTIPVSLEGMGGDGGGSTVNITMNGVQGNPNDIARAVGREVQNAFKSRSRSSGYGRGI
jgi:hypothetical protein